MFWCYSLLVKLHKIGEVLHFRLLGKKDFPVKTKNERFPAVNLRCRQNLKYENVMWTFGRLGQFITPKSVSQVQHDNFSSLNQLSHWFLVLLHAVVVTTATGTRTSDIFLFNEQNKKKTYIMSTDNAFCTLCTPSACVFHLSTFLGPCL